MHRVHDVEAGGQTDPVPWLTGPFRCFPPVLRGFQMDITYQSLTEQMAQMIDEPT